MAKILTLYKDGTKAFRACNVLSCSRRLHNVRMGTTPEFRTDEQRNLQLRARIAELEELFTDL